MGNTTLTFIEDFETINGLLKDLSQSVDQLNAQRAIISSDIPFANINTLIENIAVNAPKTYEIGLPNEILRSLEKTRVKIVNFQIKSTAQAIKINKEITGFLENELLPAIYLNELLLNIKNVLVLIDERYFTISIANFKVVYENYKNFESLFRENQFGSIRSWEYTPIKAQIEICRRQIPQKRETPSNKNVSNLTETLNILQGILNNEILPLLRFDYEVKSNNIREKEVDKELDKQLEKLNNIIEINQDNFKSIIKDIEEKYRNTISDFESKTKAVMSEMETAFLERLETFDIGTSSAKNDYETKCAESLATLQKFTEDGQQHIHYLSGRALSGFFSDRANEEKTSALSWTQATWGFASATLILLAIIFYYQFTTAAEGEKINYSLLATKVLFTATLGFIAKWTSKRANRHLMEESKYHRLAINMKTIDDFIGKLPEEKKNEILSAVALTIFTENTGSEAATDFETPNLFDIAKEAITKSAK